MGETWSIGGGGTRKKKLVPLVIGEHDPNKHVNLLLL